MRLLVQVAGGITALGIIATAAILWWDVRQDACDALLWTIQRDLFAAQREYRDAQEERQWLTEPDAVRYNEKVLESSRQSIEIFEQKRDKEKAECGR